MNVCSMLYTYLPTHIPNSTEKSTDTYMYVYTYTSISFLLSNNFTTLLTWGQICPAESQTAPQVCPAVCKSPQPAPGRSPSAPAGL